MTTATSSETLGVSAYVDRMAASSAAEQDRASQIVTHIVGVVKVFAAVKQRLHGESAESSDRALLMKLGTTGPTRASDLADQLCADPSTVSRQVAGLVRAGLIERRADPHDGRASILAPTDTGLAELDRIAERRGQMFAPLLANWSDHDKDEFIRLLGDFAHTLTVNLDTLKTLAPEMVSSAAARRSTS